MKIVKQFDDFQFFDRHYEGNEPNDPETEYWRWGLGDDGDLYCQCSDFNDTTGWYQYPNRIDGLRVNFDDMRRIVKEFGHLVIYT